MTLWMLGGVFALVGVPFLWIARAVFERDRVVRTWPRAPGVVTHSALESFNQKYRDKNGFYYDRTMYKPVVRYTYTVASHERESTRIAKAVDDVAMGEKEAQHYVDTYRLGREVSVLYDPHDPTSTWLEVQRSWGAMILLGFGCLWLGIGGLLIALSFVG